MPHRAIVDPLGRTWDVWETRPGPRSKVSPQYREGWLTFETAAEPPAKRRLVPVPLDWDQFADAQLLALLAKATPIQSARRTTMLALEEATAPPPSNQAT